ncbi:Chitooligosaccharidolytic beta-N-acetylglucosaminidase [Orchesella cincta]|uniref:Beta-hexosaminidase n=1 Tax=Orchesella cincta TaxID=48709 RepID=A0A1D2NDG0_ORCCI|nr:Chitooligosaccharidolytic beta-N-acetylglucosaminidase [Orchesella cincta]
MTQKYLFLLLIIGAIALVQGQESQTPYTFICEDNKCLKKIRSTLEDPNSGTPMNICKLNCDPLGSLWPKPTGNVNISKDVVSIDPTKVTFANGNGYPETLRNMLNGAFGIFNAYLLEMSTEREPNTGSTTSITINVSNVNETVISLSTNESYTLTVASQTVGTEVTVTATIEAATFFGARHALETLNQLVAYNEDVKLLQIVKEAAVTDGPVFPYRGVMLDTSRNYFTIEKIQKLIDGLSYNKLNVFHWHITDSYTFPMEVPSLPNMTKWGTYSPEKIYTKDNITFLVSYANQRGVKIIPELDQPAHSGFGYQWGPEAGKGDLVVCVDSEPWYDFCVQPPCGQLNIVNPEVETVIGEIFKDMVDMFGARDIFHMGGDEVDFRCYKSIPEIVAYMTANNYSQETEDYFNLWGRFQEIARKKLTEATGDDNTQIILWTSGLTDPSRIENHLDKSKYIIYIWTEEDNEMIRGLLEKGYKVIFANVNALYLDCGFQAWLGDGHNWCSPIKGWQTVYDNNPEKIYAKWVGDETAAEAIRSGQIMGSAAPLWAEQADDNALESRIFPRANAHAERLWTHPSGNHSEAEIRMVTHRNRIVARGINADRIQPEFCLQNEGKCYAEPRRGGNTNGSPKSVQFSIFVALVAAASLLYL